MGGFVALVALLATTAQTYAPLRCEVMMAHGAAAAERSAEPGHGHEPAHAPYAGHGQHGHDAGHGTAVHPEAPGEPSDCPPGHEAMASGCGAAAFLPAPLVKVVPGVIADAGPALAVAGRRDLLLRATLFHPPRA